MRKFAQKGSTLHGEPLYIFNAIEGEKHADIGTRLWMKEKRSAQVVIWG